ncbi:MAG: DUF1415 domain-containing protein [Planctomycetia bacterium]|nr:DUF1415 domain-containing protein [Planctomycetia bacterium]
MSESDQQAIIAATRRWISSIVIGLNLCPFARRVFESDRIRYVVTDAANEETLLAVLTHELPVLAAASRTEVETTILIHPNALADFYDYNDFLATADNLIRDLRLRGVIQIASFHPNYQFAGLTPDAVANYTNRSPFPMLHLLREESITEVSDDTDTLLKIPERNIETLRRLGRDEMLRRLKEVT